MYMCIVHECQWVQQTVQSQLLHWSTLFHNLVSFTNSAHFSAAGASPDNSTVSFKFHQELIMLDGQMQYGVQKLPDTSKHDELWLEFVVRI